MIPSRHAEDLVLGTWRLLGQLGEFIGGQDVVVAAVAVTDHAAVRLRRDCVVDAIFRSGALT